MPARLVPLAFSRLPPDELERRSLAVRERAATRRSVRAFSPEPVPWELLERAIAVAGTAPSGAHQQPWTFVAVSDPELKGRIRAAAEEEERRSYGGRMAAEWLAALEPLGTDWHKPHLTEAPWLVVVFEQVYGLRPDGTKVKHYYVRESVGIAVGFLLAALHEIGLAALTHTPSPMGFLREALERPANERAFAIVPVGFPAAGARVPELARKPLAEILVRR